MGLVTVCIPAYRSERWLASGLESVQRQTFPDLQVLVGIEPVEPEPTVRICREFASDERFRHHVNPTRLGWAGNIRALLRQVDTPFFVILFHDDQLHPSYVETLLPPLLERPELSVCYSDIQRFDGSTGRKSLSLRDAGLAEQLLDFFLARADALPIRGVTRSTALEEADFPENEFDGFLVESEWTLHLLLSGRALHVPEPLYLKRRPPEVRTVSQSWMLDMPADRLRAALAHNRSRMLDGIARAELSERERLPILLAAEAAFLDRYVQFARGRFRLDAEQLERARRIEREAESTLEPKTAAGVQALVDRASARDAAPKRAGRARSEPTVAVIGAGIQGVCAALELADRGYGVTLVEASKRPLDAASGWGEGKIHLGYLWAADRSLKTVERQLSGSLRFSRAIERLVGSPIPPDWLSTPYVYGVTVTSRLGADELERHFDAVDKIVETALTSNGGDYLGARELPAYRRIDPEQHFDPGRVAHAFLTPERAVDTQRVGRALAARMKGHPQISFVNLQVVDRIGRRDTGDFELWNAGGEALGRFDAVVNASGGSRIALDRTIGLEPRRPWLHRYKLAVRVSGMGLDVPTTTLVHGPFGDVVRFEEDRLWFSWYPICRVATSSELVLPSPETTMNRGRRFEIARASWDELAAFIPALRAGRLEIDQATVGGGHIFAWGDSDIEDPASGLHERFDIGVFSSGGYHSVDPGKYAMAPLFAEVVADRIGADCSSRRPSAVAAARQR